MSWLHHRQLKPSCGTAAARENKRHRDKELKQAGRELGNQARFLDERDKQNGKQPRRRYLLAGGFADLTVVPKDGFNDLQSGRLLNRRTRRFSPDYSSPHLDFDLAKAAANAGNINGWLAERVSTTRAFTPDGARKRCWESWVWAFC